MNIFSLVGCDVINIMKKCVSIHLFFFNFKTVNTINNLVIGFMERISCLNLLIYGVFSKKIFNL